MRNILLFILFLVGLFYVRRFLRSKSKPGGSPAGGSPEGFSAQREPQPRRIEAEPMVACAHCGVHVPESEGVTAGGHFYCSQEHRRLGPAG